MAEQKMLHPYPEYKDSGVEWLGKIPAHWDLLRLKNAVDDCVNGFWGDEPKNNEEDIIVLRVADFNRDQLNISDEKLTYRNISFSDQQRRLLKKGDLLIEKSGGGDKTLVGCVVLFDKPYKAITSNFVAKMSPQNGFDSRFVLHAFNILYLGDVNYRSIKQTTGIQNLDTNAYLDELFSFPPLPEQQKIADFLDYETEQMDRLIAKQERLIELLGEKRQAVISHAVTKGLNPDAPMKDSGVEWIGEIPAHWEVKKLSYCSRLITEKRVAKSAKEIVALENIEGFTGKFLETTNDLVGEGVDFQKGDVLFGKLRPYLAKVYLAEMEGVAFGDLLVYRPNPEVLSKYLWAQMLSLEFIKEVDSSTYGTKMPRAATEFISNMPIVTPPFTEQEEITQFLDTELTKMDALTAKAKQQIELLKERRTALISAAVTGKIDLRHWQPRVISQSSTP